MIVEEKEKTDKLKVSFQPKQQSGNVMFTVPFCVELSKYAFARRVC